MKGKQRNIKEHEGKSKNYEVIIESKVLRTACTPTLIIDEWP